MKEKPLLLCVGGPTGAGKTALAIELYLRHGWPIVSADSRQIYRYLDIGTNKIPQTLQAQIPHFLIDICEPSEPYSAGEFARSVEALITQWSVPVVQIVGGTGFYMEALLYGLDAVPPIPPEIRRQAESWLQNAGLYEVVQWLKAHDPLTASRIDLANPRRVLRAVEVLQATGKPWVSFWTGKRVRRYRALEVVISLERPILHEAIAQRTRLQIAAGWLEETIFVLQKGYSPTAPGLQTLGYKECLAVLRGELSQSALPEAIIAANRQYARRQLTWWRGHPPDMWLEGENLSTQVQLIEGAVFRLLEKGAEEEGELL
ncbi:MAG: tRNA (adenosine(37)-N6)-dimethylallyltransferase MiaA [Bacteroidia bacterium]|nr:tRNA (adenosine(37)-N6)-dimethylallyltransferase MiaA [Bacteroidia bacterium]MCX7764574.1 tRNA (adenosine(37)-N6)-dimethylallyltransferase MiaA [Bacteroidia bacterium]MDW8056809.1 tRNA (adenosine(37)-N6)-dimethylallyltransferase MiaA [Bacteroidia bacterium]